ncbi:ATPase, AAA-type, core [Dillenia turbinata]|uniref:ATPase, AAA-type, core n=1 Tax=Dillenia turbinata TaxID=194707 RepID=A0AAN8UQ96_9MAGN
MIPLNLLIPVLFIGFVFLVLKFLSSHTTLIFVFRNWWRSIEDRFHAHQNFRIPEFNENFQENLLYKKVSIYLNSLSSIEDSDFINLVSGKKSNEIVLQLDPNQTILDYFLGARISWLHKEINEGRSFVLKVRRQDKRRILRPYLQHIHTIFEENEQRRETKLYINREREDGWKRWTCIPFTHPANFDTLAMDSDLMNKIKSDLESFLKSKQYYHRLGRAWKRCYLLHGPSGTGKSSFIVAMAKFLNYDIYNINLDHHHHITSHNSDLKTLLLQTSNRSIIVFEDLDQFLTHKESSSLGILNFMDGFSSCCGEERIMVFTVMNKEQLDPSILRPGRIDVQIYFPLCDFNSFKSLANNYLGLKDHNLFPQLEQVFQAGARLSHAEIGEIMITNRSSPTRALKNVITALQSTNIGRRLTSDAEQRDDSNSPGVISQKSVHTGRESRKLYGLLKLKSVAAAAATAVAAQGSV